MIKAVQGVDLKLRHVHIYDPKENVIFSEENVEFSWFNSMDLSESGNNFLINKISLLLSSVLKSK